MIDVLDKTLEEVRPNANNNANEVMVCKDIHTNEMFVVARLRSRKLTKEVLGLLYEPDGRRLLPSSIFVGSTVYKGQMVLLFNYLPERKLLSHLRADSSSVKDTIDAIKNLIMAYIALKSVPSPLIGLLLQKDNVNTKPDGTIYFGSLMDLGMLDLNFSESDCVALVVDLINEMLLEFDVQDDSQYKYMKSVQLFFRKYKNNSYHSLLDVYNDFKIDDDAEIEFGFWSFKKILKPQKLFGFGKWIVIVTAIFMCVVGFNWLMKKSTLLIGYRNENLNIVGTVDMVSGE